MRYGYICLEQSSKHKLGHPFKIRGGKTDNPIFPMPAGVQPLLFCLCHATLVSWFAILSVNPVT